jgi:RNA polymerase sigma-70 factor (ECF subfamily)
VSERPVVPVAGGVDQADLIAARAGDSEAFRRLTASFTRELHLHCYRMLGSFHDAEDAVQETLLRAWRHLDTFEGRSAFRAWLYRIATNVCLRQRQRRPLDARPLPKEVEAIPQTADLAINLSPYPDALLDELQAPAGDPVTEYDLRESVQLAFLAVVQLLPPRQRAVLILCEVLRWKAGEVAELLETTVASVNSALQRARATLGASGVSADVTSPRSDAVHSELLMRYVDAFERYDLDALVSLLKTDAKQSMPPYEMWLSGRDDILSFWFGPGLGCRGSRLVRAVAANGTVAFGQYRPSAAGRGFDPWALQILEVSDDGIAELTFFLTTGRLFPLFGLPERLSA